MSLILIVSKEHRIFKCPIYYEIIGAILLPLPGLGRLPHHLFFVSKSEMLGSCRGGGVRYRSWTLCGPRGDLIKRVTSLLSRLLVITNDRWRPRALQILD
jgi:hypothetical protein